MQQHETARPRNRSGASWVGVGAARALQVAALAVLAAVAARAAGAEAGEGAPLLTLEEAVQLAQRQSHLLASTAREVTNADERAAALRTRRLPGLRVDAFGGRSLNDADFTVAAGALGSATPLGPLPPQDSKITAPADWFAAGVATISQPLTQQYRIGLGLDVVQYDRQLASEDVRRERQKLAAAVRSTYYEISANEMGVVALRDLVRAVEEVDAITTRYLGEGVALRADALEVKARLAYERQRLAAAESGLATQREHLNQLLGRSLATAFRVVPPADLVPEVRTLTLEAARERALANRPEIRRAALQAAQADAARRLALADWIPDVSLTASYTRQTNLPALPDGVGTVGLLLSWEPFDWGRRSHEAEARQAQADQAREGRQESSEQIAVEVGMRWRTLKDNAELLQARRLQAEAAQASLDTDKNRYREDAKMLRDVLRAEARLSGARHDFTDALAGYWSAAAELERAIADETY